MKTTTLKRWISLAVLVYATFSASSAFAQALGLAAVGPTDPANGYPAWYRDTNGLTLAPCLVSPGDATAPVPDPCGLAGFLPNDNAPVVFPDNFPDEFFYSFADNVIQGVGAGGNDKALLRVGILQGAFGGPTFTVADGNGAQVVFAACASAPAAIPPAQPIP